MCSSRKNMHDSQKTLSRPSVWNVDIVTISIIIRIIDSVTILKIRIIYMAITVSNCLIALHYTIRTCNIAHCDIVTRVCRYESNTTNVQRTFLLFLTNRNELITRAVIRFQVTKVWSTIQARIGALQHDSYAI